MARYRENIFVFKIFNKNSRYFTFLRGFGKNLYILKAINLDCHCKFFYFKLQSIMRMRFYEFGTKRHLFENRCSFPIRIFLIVLSHEKFMNGDTLAIESGLMFM